MREFHEDAGASIRTCIPAMICASSRNQVEAMVAEHDRRVHCPTYDSKHRLEGASRYFREFARACAFACAIRCISCVW